MNENMTNEMNDQVSTAVEQVENSGSSILPILVIAGCGIAAITFGIKKYRDWKKSKEIDLNKNDGPVEVEVVDGGKTKK